MLYLGYDPGGNDKHGVAALRWESGKRVSIRTATLPSTESVLRWFQGEAGRPLAIGVDTLTCWSTGPSGWRPADRWLRQRYPEVSGSVASPNSLYGSMSLNGMSVLLELRKLNSNLLVTETHPKVLHWHIQRLQYDYVLGRAAMDDVLKDQVGCIAHCETDHEWDAAISAVAAYKCESRQWTRDLHLIPTLTDERLVNPCGQTKYAWPD